MGGGLCIAGVCGACFTAGCSLVITIGGCLCCCSGKVGSSFHRTKASWLHLDKRTEWKLVGVLKELHTFGLAVSIYTSGYQCLVDSPIGGIGVFPQGKLEALRISSMVGSNLIAGAALSTALSAFSGAVIVAQGMMTVAAGANIRGIGKQYEEQAKAMQTVKNELLKVWPDRS